MTSAFLYILLFALPFGTRKLLFQFTPGFHEYEAAFLYASDILLVAFLVVAAHAYIQENKKARKQESKADLFPERSRRVTLSLFVLLAGVSVFFAPDKLLASYAFARLTLAVAFAVAVAYVFRRGIVCFDTICTVIAASAVFQSLIAFAQFARQGSSDLWLLGEPALSAHAPGIAKFAVAGGKILRAYGTFPHPNVLGAFLVLGLISLCYLWLRKQEPNVIAKSEATKQPYDNVRLLRLARNDDFFVAGIFIVLLGLVLTFSRTAWLVAIIASIALLLYCFARSELRRRALLLLVVLVASGYTLVAILRPFVFPRARISTTEPSVVARLEYNTLGLSLVREHPLGVGVGNQVLYSVRNGLYQKVGMTKAWQWEPVHNIYLLMASEIGIVGAVALVAFLVSLFLNSKSQARNPKQYQNPNDQNRKPFYILSFRNLNLFRIWDLELSISAIMLVALLLLGLTDHFLWTLQPGRLMLWFVIGIAWGVAKSSKKD
ncbi:MAG: O-antigen ligase family protein [bacterium]|nr:O-antigen ligase family protein [bacterium]